MADLKLVAFDAEDLQVISAHVQDAVVQVGEMAYLPAERRFAAIVNRFDWAKATGCYGDAGLERRRTALRFERVLEAKCQGIDLKSKQQVMELLAIQFDETDAPGGYVTMVFAGGPAVRLKVECIEAELRDLGAAWKARRKPEHPDIETVSER